MEARDQRFQFVINMDQYSPQALLTLWAQNRHVSSGHLPWYIWTKNILYDQPPFHKNDACNKLMSIQYSDLDGAKSKNLNFLPKKFEVHSNFNILI